MPKRNQQRPGREAHGHNNPGKSTTITTGTYKKKETYQEQAQKNTDYVLWNRLNQVPDPARLDEA